MTHASLRDLLDAVLDQGARPLHLEVSTKDSANPADRTHESFRSHKQARTARSEVGDMNFTGAIQAHSNWKLRLVAQCRGTSSENIDVQMLAKDNACELGKWIHGLGQQYASDPRFKQLINLHAAFHKSAAAIAQMIGSGAGHRSGSPHTLPESEFGRLSVGVLLTCLMGLRSQYGDA